MRVSLALLFASYPFFFSFLLLAADAASDPISHILFDASVAAFPSPRREGKRLVKAKIRKGINRLSVKFEYFFPPRFAGQKREREREKYVIKMQRVFVLFQRCYSRQKTNQDNEDEHESRVHAGIPGKRVNLH